MNSKKGIAFRFILEATLVVFLIVISFILLRDPISSANIATSCEGTGGVIAPSCDRSVAVIKPDAKNKAGEGYCCVRAPLADQEDFETWAQQYKTGPNTNDPASQSSDGNFASETYSIPANKRNTDFAQILFGVTDITQETAVWEVGVPYLVEGINGVSGTTHCILEVFKRNPSGTLDKKETATSSNCAMPSSELAAKISLEKTFAEPGAYHVELTIRDKPNDEEYKAFVEGDVKVNDPILVVDYSTSRPSLTLSGSQVEQVFRLNKNLCFVDVKSNNIPQEDQPNIQYQGKTIGVTEQCNFAGLQPITTNQFNYYELNGGIDIATNEKLCLKATYTYQTEINGQQQSFTVSDNMELRSIPTGTQSGNTPGCDEVVLIKKTNQATLSGANQACPDCRTLGTQCNVLNARQSPACVLSAECYYRDPFIGKEGCFDCDDPKKPATKCSDYKTIEGCRENACLDNICEWDFIRDRCTNALSGFANS